MLFIFWLFKLCWIVHNKNMLKRESTQKLTHSISNDVPEFLIVRAWQTQCNCQFYTCSDNMRKIHPHYEIQCSAQRRQVLHEILSFFPYNTTQLLLGKCATTASWWFALRICYAGVAHTFYFIKYDTETFNCKPSENSTPVNICNACGSNAIN